jgi:hypothetical protein
MTMIRLIVGVTKIISDDTLQERPVAKGLKVEVGCAKSERITRLRKERTIWRRLQNLRTGAGRLRMSNLKERKYRREKSRRRRERAWTSIDDADWLVATYLFR